MKYLVGLLIITFMISCKSEKKQHEFDSSDKTEEKSDELPLDWLIGSWKRVGEKKGNQTYEYWNRKNDDTLIGVGCTLQGADTVWREDILLIKRADGWKFEVTGLGDSLATVFAVTQLESDNFICENQENDFPKKIQYTFDGTNINATISGGGDPIPFNFVPLKQ